jgi:predicted TIM-barrel fold metal-dependent hydrolase
VALQHPDLAAEQLEEAVKKYGLRGAAIGGNVAGEEISDPKFHPFWAKAEELGVSCSSIRRATAPRRSSASGSRATATSATSSAIRSRPRLRSRT